MTVKVRLLVGFVALLGAAMLLPAAAWASEPEDPFWKVTGKRLEAASWKASIKNVSGVKTNLQSKIGVTPVEIRCGSSALGEGLVEGSQAKQPGKTSGILELSACKLFAKEGGQFVEQTECTVPSIKSGRLAGTLWLEGTRAAAGTTAVVVLAPRELTEGKPLVAKVVIEGCASFKGTRTLEGSLALRLLPQNEEFTFIQWALPATGITTAWLPPSQETSIGLKLEGNTANLQGEVKVELESHEAFGGGIDPVDGIEAPLWGVQYKRLGAGEEKELESSVTTEPARLAIKLMGTRTETLCNHAGLKGPRIGGSSSQSDGRFYVNSIELSECKLLAEEGGKFVEQKACEITPLNTNALTGHLWLRGTAEERGKKPVLVLEPESKEKPVIAEESIKSKSGESCMFAEEKYAIEGAILVRITPESEEHSVLELSIDESSGYVWQPAQQATPKRQVVVFHGKEPIGIKVPRIPLQLKSGTLIGGGPVGVASLGGTTKWYVNGVQLSQKDPPRQIKLQQKGITIFSSPRIGLTVYCLHGNWESATIEGTTKIGQGKGRIAYTGCVVSKPEIEGCSIAEPLTTPQTKSYLAETGKQNNIVDVIEPTTGTTFVEIGFGKGCGILAGTKSVVTGNVAAEVIPKKGQATEIILVLPETPIETVKREEVEKTIGLTLGGTAATLSSSFGARLATNEPFGV